MPICDQKEDAASCDTPSFPLYPKPAQPPRITAVVKDQWYKTKICPHFLGRGCYRGALCSYAHGSSELRSEPKLRKTKLCPQFLAGSCRKPAAECSFAHGPEDLWCTEDYYKTDICRFWKKGKCSAGGSCRHAHGPGELRPRNYRLSEGEKGSNPSESGSGNAAPKGAAPYLPTGLMSGGAHAPHGFSHPGVPPVPFDWILGAMSTAPASPDGEPKRDSTGRLLIGGERLLELGAVNMPRVETRADSLFGFSPAGSFASTGFAPDFTVSPFYTVNRQESATTTATTSSAYIASAADPLSSMWSLPGFASGTPLVMSPVLKAHDTKTDVPTSPYALHHQTMYLPPVPSPPLQPATPWVLLPPPAGANTPPLATSLGGEAEGRLGHAERPSNGGRGARFDSAAAKPQSPQLGYYLPVLSPSLSPFVPSRPVPPDSPTTPMYLCFSPSLSGSGSLGGAGDTPRIVRTSSHPSFAASNIAKAFKARGSFDVVHGAYGSPTAASSNAH